MAKSRLKSILVPTNAIFCRKYKKTLKKHKSQESSLSDLEKTWPP
jgi:hypothetical protein